MSPIAILPLHPEEWQAYRRIRLEALSQEPQAFSSTYAENASRPAAYWQGRLREAQAGGPGWLLFASESGRVVGMIGAYPSGDGESVAVISVYVTPSQRRQGVGAALLAAVLDAVRQDGSFRKAVLTVNARQPAAVALYRRFGFQVVGEQTEVMGDGNVYLSYVMEKDLPLQG